MQKRTHHVSSSHLSRRAARVIATLSLASACIAMPATAASAFADVGGDAGTDTIPAALTLEAQSPFAELTGTASAVTNYGAWDDPVVISTTNEEQSGVEVTFAQNELLARAASGVSDLANAMPDLVDDETLGRKYTFSDLAIHDQNPYGTCWAFSAIACLEASAVKHGLATADIDLSEFQLAYFMYNKRGVADPLGLITGDYNLPLKTTACLDNGGNHSFTMWTLASWCGAVDDSLAPYTPKEYDMTTTALDDVLAFESDSYHVNGVQIIPSYRRDSIKQAIVVDGAVAVSMNYNPLYSNSTDDCYYDNVDTTSNHEVAIVGWDDDFDRTKFERKIYQKDADGKIVFDDQGQPVVDEEASAATMPSANGAWLVKNSGNTQYSGEWGLGGYFWMSYENATNTPTAYVFFYAYSVEAADAHDNNYQYDGSASCNTNFLAAGESVANVYTAHGNAGGTEVLDSIGVGLSSTQVGYSVQVYGDLTDPNDPTSGTPLLETPATGTTGFAGYVTIPLGQEVELREGETFSVVFTNTSANQIFYYAESALSNSYISCNPQIDPGQSFVSNSGTWSDLASGTTPSCARLKAFTRNVGGAEELSVAASCPAAEKGTKASVTTTLAGADAASYRFYYSVDGGTTWTQAAKNTTGAFSVTANATNAARPWKVVVTTADGRTAEAAFAVTVSDPVVTATVTPAAGYGAKATVNVAASGYGVYGPAKYRYYYSADGGATWTRVAYHNRQYTDTDSLHLTGNATNAKRQWKVVVTFKDRRTVEVPFVVSYTK